MALTAVDKAAIVKEHQREDGDTGSPEVQIALMTARIEGGRQGKIHGERRDRSE